MFETVIRNTRKQTVIYYCERLYGENTNFLIPFEFLYLSAHLNIYSKPKLSRFWNKTSSIPEVLGSFIPNTNLCVNVGDGRLLGKQCS